MNKWKVEVTFAVSAKTRGEAWKLAQSITEEKLGNLAAVTAVSMKPYKEWKAVNEA